MSLPRPAPGIAAIPDATVARLPLYLRALHMVADGGSATVSSSQLAAAAGVNSAKVRKDLSYLGSHGVRGVGYHVSLLTEQISTSLGLANQWGVALVGVGRLGQALAHYAGFSMRGFPISALLDADRRKVGRQIAGLSVHHLDELPAVVAAHNIAIAMIATPAEAAQDVCDRLIAAGVTSILNFAPSILFVPNGVDVRKVDLAIELQILSFHEHRKATRAHRPPNRTPRRDSVRRRRGVDAGANTVEVVTDR